MNDADPQKVDTQMTADILSQEKPNPTRDDKQHHSARVSAQDDVKAKTIHGGDDKGEDEHRVRHVSCESINRW